MNDSLTHICTKAIEWSLVFIIAVAPLIINPLAFDLWYRPKIASVQVLLLIAGIAWLAMALFRKEGLHWQWNVLTVALLAYVIAAVVSTIFSINTALSFYGDHVRLEGLCTIVTYVSLVFLFKHNVQTPELAGRLFVCFVLCATLVSLYALFQYFCYNPTEHFFYKYFPKGNGVGSTIGNPNFLGKYLVLVIPVVLAMYLCETGRFRLMGLFCSLALCFAALIATFTRASWLGLLAGMIVLLYCAQRNALLNGKGRRLILIAISLFFVVCLFNAYSPSHDRQKLASTAKQSRGEVIQKAATSFDINKGRGVATRLYVWDRTLRLIGERPWFGYGLETFMLVFKQFNQEYTEIFHDRVIIDRAHNNYLDIAFTIGLTGLAAYLAILLSFLRYVSRLFKALQDRSNKMLFLGILAAFCGYLINDIFIFSVVSVSPTFWSLMGLTIAAGELVRANGKTVQPKDQKPDVAVIGKTIT